MSSYTVSFQITEKEISQFNDKLKLLPQVALDESLDLFGDSSSELHQWVARHIQYEIDRRNF